MSTKTNGKYRQKPIQLVFFLKVGVEAGKTIGNTKKIEFKNFRLKLCHLQSDGTCKIETG